MPAFLKILTKTNWASQRESKVVTHTPSENKTIDVQEAMQDELNKYKMFDAYEVVKDKGQDRIDGRWVVNKKEEHDGLKTKYKARWCLRGYKETDNWSKKICI